MNKKRETFLFPFVPLIGEMSNFLMEDLELVLQPETIEEFQRNKMFTFL